MAVKVKGGTSSCNPVSSNFRLMKLTQGNLHSCLHTHALTTDSLRQSQSLRQKLETEAHWQAAPAARAWLACCCQT